MPPTGIGDPDRANGPGGRRIGHNATLHFILESATYFVEKIDSLLSLSDPLVIRLALFSDCCFRSL